MTTIHPFLIIHNRAKEAADHYVATFPDAEIRKVVHHGPDSWQAEGEVLSVSLSIGNQVFIILNGGPPAPSTMAVSFHIDCADQAEIDRYWDALTDGGTPMPCGWVRDRFGVHWQVIPARLIELLTGPDRDQYARAMAAMMTMTKIDLAAIEAAAKGA